MKLFSTTPRRATVNYLRFTAQSNQLPKFIRRLTDQERGRLNFADGNPDLPWYGYFSAEADLLLWADNIDELFNLLSEFGQYSLHFQSLSS